jgi:hypothetical protein
LYGGDHQADEKGGDTFIGNQVVKQECKFPSLIMSQWNCVLAVNVAQVPNSMPDKSNQYEEYLHKLLGDNPLPHHFSDEFLNDADVTKVAKISCYGPAAMFFSKVFGRLLHEEDVEFDSICQKMNEYLLQLFAKCMLSMDSKQVWLNEALFQFLQSKTFTYIVQ